MALSQVSALQAKQKSKDKEVEALRRQIMDYQVIMSGFLYYYTFIYLKELVNKGKTKES